MKENNNIRILLINPPQTFPKEYYSIKDMRASIPLGLLNIAASIEREGYSIKLIDSIIYKNQFKITQNKDKLYLGCSYESIRKEIFKYKPHIIGVSSPYSSQINNAFMICKIAKEIDKNIIVVGGGPHASIKPEDFFNLSNFDFVVMAEGEKAFVELIDNYDHNKKKILNYKNIPNISYKLNNKIFKNNIEYIEDLDSLPFPAYHMINLEKYFDVFKKGFISRPYVKTNKIMSLITSRGCPFNCVFCSIHTHMGRKWRYNSSKYVLNHIKLLVEKYGVKHISFEDDNLTVNLKRFEDILDGIILNSKKNKAWDISWDTPNGVRADILTKEVLSKAKEAGLLFLVIGVESGNQKVLDTIIKKNLNLKKVVGVAKWCKELGINLSAFFVIGFPGETKKDIQDTFNFAMYLNRKLDVLPSMGIAAPLLNTELYNIAKEKGYLTENVTNDNIIIASSLHGKGLIKTEEFSPQDLIEWAEKFHRKIILYQLLKPKYLIKKFFQSPKLFFSMTKQGIKKIVK